MSSELKPEVRNPPKVKKPKVKVDHSLLIKKEAEMMSRPATAIPSEKVSSFTIVRGKVREVAPKKVDGESERKICTFFAYKGSCKFGDRCRDLHVRKAIPAPRIESEMAYRPFTGEARRTNHKAKTVTKPLAIKKKEKEIVDPSEYKQFEKMITRIYEDLARLEPVRKASYSGRSLDLMFIIDCTGSMTCWIEACKREIRSIIDSIMS